MGFYRNKKEIIENFNDSTKELRTKIMQNSGKQINMNVIEFANQEYKTSKNYSPQAFPGLTMCKKSSYLVSDSPFIDENGERKKRIIDIGDDYVEFKIDLKTAQYKLLCEAYGIDTELFKTTNAKVFNAIAILNSQGIDVTKFRHFTKNQLSVLSDKTFGKITKENLVGGFVLAKLKDEADIKQNIEVELGNGYIFEVERSNYGYRYFLDGLQVDSVKAIEHLASEDRLSGDLESVIAVNLIEQIHDRNNVIEKVLDFVK